MAELSPAAQAVLDVMRRSYDHEQTRRAIAAEILRAAADQVVPLRIKTPWGSVIEPSPGALRIRAAFYSIAAELEA